MQLSKLELIEGFRRSYSKTKDAKNRSESLEVFYALFETMNWIVCIDDKLKNSNPNWIKNYSDEDVQLLKAIRYARNRVHHQWVEIMSLRDKSIFPAQFPISFHEWVWRKSVDLPLADSQHPDINGKCAYEFVLQGQPIKLALIKIDSIFSKELSS